MRRRKTNRHLIARMSSFHGDRLWGFIRVGTGLARVKMDKATVRSMLREAGPNHPAKHHVYIEQRELHIALLEDCA